MQKHCMMRQYGSDRKERLRKKSEQTQRVTDGNGTVNEKWLYEEAVIR